MTLAAIRAWFAIAFPLEPVPPEFRKLLEKLK